MFSTTKLDRHAALMNRMADTVGVDLGEALVEGRLSGEGLRSAILRCTACDNPEACDHWLADRAPGSAEDTPEYCRNRALLAGLGGA